MIIKTLFQIFFYTLFAYFLLSFNCGALAQTGENTNWQTINNFTSSDQNSRSGGTSDTITDDEFFDAINSIENIKQTSRSDVETITDDEFLKKISSIENTAALLKQTDNDNKKKLEVVKFYSEYFSSNRKPGYLLFSTNDETNDSSSYDYKINGYSSKIKCFSGYKLSFEGGYYKSYISENTTEQVNLQKINLLIDSKLVPGVNMTANARQITLSNDSTYNEYELNVSSFIDTLQLDAGVSKNVYTGDSSSYSDPPEYYRMNIKAGCELSNEFYIELEPAFETYLKNENKKREISTSLLYMPSEFPRLSLNIYYMLFKFENERDAAGQKYAYFAPGLSKNIGLGLNYMVDLNKKSKLNLGLNLEKEKYYYNEEPTQYYMLSAISGLNVRLSSYMKCNFTYGFSVSQTDGFPFTQNMRLNTEIRF